MKISVTIILIFLCCLSLFGQHPDLNKYVDLALENNLALKQQEFSFQKSMASLKEARGMFFPSVGINARYTRAGGGRTIEFPVGDLLNPAYQSINSILTSLGQQPRPFPTLENQEIPFLREEEHETKVRLIQPIFQPSIYYNYQIRKYMSKMESAAKDVYVRQLVADVKTAYFNYLKTEKVLKIYQETEDLLKENLRVNRKLVEQQKATKEVIYRARAELSELEQQKAEAMKNQELAQSYFNFLLNRDLNESIEIVEMESLPPEWAMSLQGAQNHALEKRDEIEQLKMAVETAQNGVKMSRTNFLPGISAVVDYGFQGEEYRFTEDDDFWMASAILEWNLFNGFRDQAKVQQAKLEQKRFNTRLSELKSQIRLQVEEAYQNVIVSQKTLKTAEDRLQSAQKSFEIINKKYEQGMVPQIEYLDARNTLTRAELNKAISRYDYQIKKAEFEHVTALYPLERNHEKSN